MTDQTRKCANCMWWLDMGHSAKLGVCRGGPPVMATNGRAGWPVTRGEEDWCGSFRLKEPPPALMEDDFVLKETA